jgi:lycopene cyclase domain-containing protein
MHRYLLLNAAFVLLAGIVCWYLRRHIRWSADLRVLAVMLALTAIFDTLWIHIGIFAYRPEYILGVFIGKAPVEDFAYSLVAAMLIPLLWRKLKADHEKPQA